MASYLQKSQPSYPSSSIPRSDSRFHKADSLPSEASSTVGRRQKSVNSDSFCGYYAPNESENGFEMATQNPRELMKSSSMENESIRAATSYANEFSSLKDSVQKRPAATLHTRIVPPSERSMVRGQAAKVKNRQKSLNKAT